MKNKLRIIGGDWRSRQLSFVDAPGLRPTPARVRETLFNWLQYEIFGKQCLDLYAGSGALGFEAASRGAKSVIQVENNVQACHCLKDNALALSATDRIKVVQSDVLRYLAGDAQAFDVVFLDPPFGRTNPPGADLHLPEGRRAGQPCVTNPPGADLHLPERRRAGQPCVTLVIQTCRQLEAYGWLAKHAKIYVETERHFDFSGMPENWRQLKSKSAGEVGYHLFERIE
ncbi:MAG: 16S rRNA (guanine(966)-N(2))-methyltransferase RsmD [Methylobacter sp.]|uniref:16S rRNA (guanine(966)-N(2))-methyltransferase RsmD n=1 Tax=Methylobacter sp. TaxID=2051955 RepID=UPI0027311CCA|nr:16S rRNA (guanine(966)-N(2))-methyltransferase RsmD [Methylobacter sp.]MDP1665373.1 16S rRNA (guanine(966)-N(2))-methyltransferase RsmD [Methylobacter sp.]MDP1969333.1 16S rRNA (guanine(966)-N(2))-methyltransferase RsmD [Methylobacter sp.]